MKFEFDLNMEEFTVFYAAVQASKKALESEIPEIKNAMEKISLKFDEYLADLGMEKPS